jgi:hypothetical protein
MVGGDDSVVVSQSHIMRNHEAHFALPLLVPPPVITEDGSNHSSSSSFDGPQPWPHDQNHKNETSNLVHSYMRTVSPPLVVVPPPQYDEGVLPTSAAAPAHVLVRGEEGEGRRSEEEDHHQEYQWQGEQEEELLVEHGSSSPLKKKPKTIKDKLPTIDYLLTKGRPDLDAYWIPKEEVKFPIAPDPHRRFLLPLKFADLRF